jgi:hypothetical protein
LSIAGGVRAIWTESPGNESKVGVE